MSETIPNPQSKKPRKALPVTDAKFYEHRGANAEKNAFSRGYSVKITVHSPVKPQVLEYHLDDGATTVSAMPFSEFVQPGQWTVVRSSSSNFVGHQGLMFALTGQHILALSDLDEDDPEFVRPEVSAKANGVLEEIERGSRAYAPQVFSHGGDAVVLTWEGEKVAKLLTISASSVKLLAVERGSKERHSIAMDLDKNDDRVLLMQTLGGIPSLTTLEKDEF